MRIQNILFQMIKLELQIDGEKRLYKYPNT